MTPLILLDDLKDEMRTLFEHELFRYPEANTEKRLNVYQQNLPRQSAIDSEEEMFPYILIATEEGGQEEGAPSREAAVDFIIGTWDDNPDMQGYKVVMNVIEKIQRRFGEDSRITKFRAMGESEWKLANDETTAPYFYGILRMKFQLPRYERRDYE